MALISLMALLSRLHLSAWASPIGRSVRMYMSYTCCVRSASGPGAISRRSVITLVCHQTNLYAPAGMKAER
ncbi:hypothetical protein F5Y07DRAFT_347642 [Xylaria sp. FL0933]|nr:hypothetical protein F5Y07DRAFT_347642 [Xylaria sp. FL0933]